MKCLIDFDVLKPQTLKVPNGRNYLLYPDGTLYSSISGRILKGYVGKNNYLYYTLCDKKRYYAHRLLALHFIPNKENKREVNHKDGNRLNNCLTNLEWVTPSENVKHAHTLKSRKRLTSYNHPNNKLSRDEIIEIYNSKQSMTALSKIYDVNVTTISNIKRGRTNSWVRKVGVG